MTKFKLVEEDDLLPLGFRIRPKGHKHWLQEERSDRADTRLDLYPTEKYAQKAILRLMSFFLQQRSWSVRYGENRRDSLEKDVQRFLDEAKRCYQAGKSTEAQRMLQRATEAEQRVLALRDLDNYWLVLWDDDRSAHILDQILRDVLQEVDGTTVVAYLAQLSDPKFKLVKRHEQAIFARFEIVPVEPPLKFALPTMVT